MQTDFNKYAAKGNEVLNLLADQLQISPKQAIRILRSVLHTVRDHISVDESLQLMAQMPIAIKGLYVDQWKPSSYHQRIHHLYQFIDEIREHDGGAASVDLGNNSRAEAVIRAVFSSLSYFVSEGEMKDVTAALPEEIRSFILDGFDQHNVVL